ncbi:MAG: aldose 1-epimerase [Bacteroidales bacterium]|nr:aldose 1-epimerase [Clostridium sp.]MCM1203686.1 aldose 1-epimerase [Bacteroidales bacterium]
MKTSCKEVQLNGAPVIEMKAGGYLAIIAPTVGSNIARLRDCRNKIEILRFHKERPLEKLAASPEVYGLPTLYLPNRLNHGRLRVSDAVYQFPVNEGRFQNHIHGFLHKRNHTVVETSTDGEKAIARTQYVYDEKDLFFDYFPVKFQADYEFILDEEGMHYRFTLTNLSDKQMPYGVCNHAAFKAPFLRNGKGRDIRLQIPAVKRCGINERRLPTGELLNLSAYDEQYVKGTKLVNKVPIDNDMYLVTTGELDGKPFYGAIMTDKTTGKRICYEVDEAFKFFIVWNDRGTKDYYCPEPMTWMIDAPNLDLPAEATGYLELSPKESKTVTEHIFTA